jgi:MarR family transcriptional regulator, negative regulator of the multidrug operon emrRAB
MSLDPDPIATLEQNLTRVGHRCPNFPSEFAKVTRLLKLLSWHMSGRGNSVLSPWGITFNEYNMLTLLYGHAEQAMSATELNSIIGEASNYTHRLIHLLHRRGLVIRSYHETDRRKLVVSLSDAGVRMMEEMLPVTGGMAHHVVSLYTPEEISEFARLMKVMLKAITT